MFFIYYFNNVKLRLRDIEKKKRDTFNLFVKLNINIFYENLNLFLFHKVMNNVLYEYFAYIFPIVKFINLFHA